MDSRKSQFTPLTYIVIGIVIVLLLLFLFSNNQTQSPLIFQERIPTENPYKDCITWQETEYHDGETVCIIGKVIFINYTYDELSGEKLWGARFSMEQDSFHLVSVGSSLDEWQGKCVIIAQTGEIAHLNRSKPHSGERENAGQGYCTSCVRHSPVSAHFSLRITE